MERVNNAENGSLSLRVIFGFTNEAKQFIFVHGDA